MEHQTAILTLVRGLASLLVAVQVLGVQFQRTCNHHSRMHIITPIIKHTHTQVRSSRDGSDRMVGFMSRLEPTTKSSPRQLVNLRENNP